MLGSANDTDTVVADFEAGLGTLTRMGDHRVDVVCVVVEPSSKALEAGRRLATYAAEQGQGRVMVVANRMRDETDHRRVAEALPGLEVLAVPDDPAVLAADRAGRAPLDAAPDCPAVMALLGLADRLA